MPDQPRSRTPLLARPISWRVVDRTAGAVDWMLLGDQDNDSFRIAVNVFDSDVTEAEAQIVYPCRVCGWASACADGEDCHS